MPQIVKSPAGKDKMCYYFRLEPKPPYPGGTVMLGDVQDNKWTAVDALYTNKGRARFGDKICSGGCDTPRLGFIVDALQAVQEMAEHHFVEDAKAVKNARQVLQLYWMAYTIEQIEEFLHPSNKVAFEPPVTGDDLTGGFDDCDSFCEIAE